MRNAEVGRKIALPRAPFPTLFALDSGLQMLPPGRKPYGFRLIERAYSSEAGGCPMPIITNHSFSLSHLLTFLAYPAPRTPYPVPRIQYQASSIQYPSSSIQHPVSSALSRAPNAFYLIPYTLNLIPFLSSVQHPASSIYEINELMSLYSSCMVSMITSRESVCIFRRSQANLSRGGILLSPP